MMAGIEVSERARSYFYNDPGNDSAAKVPGYAITNARIYVASEGDRRWEGSLSVQNMFNRLYVTSIFLLGGIGEERYGFYGRPRWITAELTYHF
jgi:outer membrane receptor protein involved in Fe transport